MVDAKYIARRLADGAACSLIAKECGISRQRVYQLIEEHGFQRPVRTLNPPTKTKLAFWSQRKNAARRGIAWELTYDQWMAIWQSSGKLELRGRTKGGFVMARFGDVGPYAVGNVKICPNRENFEESKLHAKKRDGVHLTYRLSGITC